MTVLGIDPGLATMGFGIISKEREIFKVLDYGVICTPKEESIAVRLAMLEEKLNILIEKYNPDEIAVEELFFNSNQKTAIMVAQARGAILLSCIKRCGRLFEYTPLQIKQGLTGYGRADKNQIQQMVKLLLKLEAVPRPDDAADALAVALCHLNTNKLSGKFII